MRTFTASEAGEWSREHGIPLTEYGLPDLSRIGDKAEFRIPVDSGKRTYMVKSQMEGVLQGGPVLLWLSNWDVWPSGQWYHLFDRFKKSYGCEEPLIKQPAHLVDMHEYEAAVSIGNAPLCVEL